ncbi:hypothetical protein BDZ91DRAFT_799370 [Kalaharituber pfeilii]|nr:hypothetical protein BDZ91DRAFT_799370 [Kalaharituber pfeilii]
MDLPDSICDLPTTDILVAVISLLVEQLRKFFLDHAFLTGTTHMAYLDSLLQMLQKRHPEALQISTVQIFRHEPLSDRPSWRLTTSTGEMAEPCHPGMGSENREDGLAKLRFRTRYFQPASPKNSQVYLSFLFCDNVNTRTNPSNDTSWHDVDMNNDESTTLRENYTGSSNFSGGSAGTVDALMSPIEVAIQRPKLAINASSAAEDIGLLSPFTSTCNQSTASQGLPTTIDPQFLNLPLDGEIHKYETIDAYNISPSEHQLGILESLPIVPVVQLQPSNTVPKSRRKYECPWRCGATPKRLDNLRDHLSRVHSVKIPQAMRMEDWLPQPPSIPPASGDGGGNKTGGQEMEARRTRATWA